MNFKRKITIITILLGLTLSALGEPLKAISFNVHSAKSQDNDALYAWVNRRDAVIMMIRHERPAVIGLQEGLIDQLTFIDRKLHYYRRVGVAADNGLSRGEYTAIYYDLRQVELLGYNTYWLSERPQRATLGWDAGNYRTVTVAHFRDKKSKKDFYYYNTQLDSQGKVARRESIKVIVDLIDKEAGSGTPVILGGDMRVDHNDTIFAPLNEIGMLSARSMASHTSYRNTYNGYGKKSAKRTDHFFVRNMKVEQFFVLNSSYTVGERKVRYLSSHYPIRILFEL